MAIEQLVLPTQFCNMVFQLVHVRVYGKEEDGGAYRAAVLLAVPLS